MALRTLDVYQRHRRPRRGDPTRDPGHHDPFTTPATCTPSATSRRRWARPPAGPRSSSRRRGWPPAVRSCTSGATSRTIATRWCWSASRPSRPAVASSPTGLVRSSCSVATSRSGPRSSTSRRSRCADQGELVDWLAGSEPGRPRVTYIVHGEPGASAALQESVVDRLGWNDRGAPLPREGPPGRGPGPPGGRRVAAIGRRCSLPGNDRPLRRPLVPADDAGAVRAMTRGRTSERRTHRPAAVGDLSGRSSRGQLLAGGPLDPDVLQLIGDAIRMRSPPAHPAHRVGRRLADALRRRGGWGDEALADHLGALSGRGPTPLLRPLPVSLDELSDVLEGDPINGDGRIDRRTGEVWFPPQIQCDRDGRGSIRTTIPTAGCR